MEYTFPWCFFEKQEKQSHSCLKLKNNEKENNMLLLRPQFIHHVWSKMGIAVIEIGFFESTYESTMREIRL